MENNDFIAKFNASKYLNKTDRIEIVNKFYDDTPPLNDIPEDEIIGSIYMIYNINNGMRYIGQTKDFKRRVAEYIRYSNPNKEYNEHTRMSSMYRIIQTEGIENFKIRRYYDCRTFEELAEKEHEFIIALNTVHPNGYNLNLNLEYHHYIKTNKKGRPSEISIPHSPNAKRKKSNPVFLIDTETKSIIFSDSAVLFGIAILGMSRETAKCIRQYMKKHYKINNRYYIYPADIESLLLEMRITQLNNYSLEYVYYANEISYGINYLIDNGYNFMILRYEDNSSGYSFYSIQTFLQLLSKSNFENMDTKEMRTSIG